MDKRIELKPCPFCGGEANFVHESRDYDDVFYIECTECDA